MGSGTTDSAKKLQVDIAIVVDIHVNTVFVINIHSS
jgi:hypothetical protein